MIVKIGNMVFNGDQFAPMMIELTQKDKENIANMAPDATKYAVFPDDWGTPEEMRAWMAADDGEKN